MKSCFVSTSLPSHCAELSTVVRYLGLKMTEVEVQELFDEFDEDKSGSIEFDEFLILISKKVIILVFERKYDDIIIWCKKEWNNEIFMLYVFLLLVFATVWFQYISLNCCWHSFVLLQNVVCHFSFLNNRNFSKCLLFSRKKWKHALPAHNGCIISEC